MAVVLRLLVNGYCSNGYCSNGYCSIYIVVTVVMVTVCSNGYCSI